MELSRFKLKALVRWFLVGQMVVVCLLVVYLAMMHGPLVIGAGRFEHLLQMVETTDYRWWVVIGLMFYLMAVSTLFILFVLADISNWQIEEIKKHFYTLIRDKHIPVTVDIHENIPIHLDHPVSAPFSVETTLQFDQSVAVKAMIPVKLDLPIDTSFEASVMGLGKIRIPIKTVLPIDIQFPYEGEVHMKVDNFHFAMKEMAQVELPPMSVPVHCQVRAQLNIESNLQQVEKMITKKPQS